MKDSIHRPSRRDCIALLAFAPVLQFPSKQDADSGQPRDWTCPMDPDVHLDSPGKCPRCGMTLVLKVPDRVEYPMRITANPPVIEPGSDVMLTFQVTDPAGNPVRHFETVHEKLIHLFIVSENLEFFAHVHPQYQSDGSFQLGVRLPYSGMYRLLADYYPSGSVPQLALNTLYAAGPACKPLLKPSLAPERTENLTAALRLEPEQLLAGFESKLIYDLTPSDGLEKYLGAWGHMLAASEDLVDLMHFHPVLAGGSIIQYNVIFPRAGIYKVWSQFQRDSVVNTTAFTVAVKNL